MTYDRFISQLSKAGLSVTEFAELIGMNRNSISNYARNNLVPKHLAVVAALIAEMNTQGIAFKPIIASLDMTPQKPRGAAKPGHFGGTPQQLLELEP